MAQKITSLDLEVLAKNGFDENKLKAFKLRYGLIDGKEHTLYEISKETGLSRERVRQLVAKAEKCLRENAVAEESKK